MESASKQLTDLIKKFFPVPHGKKHVRLDRKQTFIQVLRSWQVRNENGAAMLSATMWQLCLRTSEDLRANTHLAYFFEKYQERDTDV